jgi:hypothetical protein
MQSIDIAEEHHRGAAAVCEPCTAVAEDMMQPICQRPACPPLEQHPPGSPGRADAMPTALALAPGTPPLPVRARRCNRKTEDAQGEAGSKSIVLATLGLVTLLSRFDGNSRRSSLSIEAQDEQPSHPGQAAGDSLAQTPKAFTALVMPNDEPLLTPNEGRFSLCPIQ